MPIIDDNAPRRAAGIPYLVPERPAAGIPYQVPAPEPELTYSPSVAETFGAAFQQGNTVRSFVGWAADAITPRDPFERKRMAEREASGEIYDPIAEIRGTKYEPHAMNFVEAESAAEAWRIKARIDREEENRAALDAAGGLGMVAAIAAGGLDLPTLIPGGAALRSARLGERMLYGGLTTGAAGLASTAIQEAGLQATQETRTADESLINIAGGTVLSAGLGAAIPAIGAAAGRWRGNRAPTVADPARNAPAGEDGDTSWFRAWREARNESPSPAADAPPGGSVGAAAANDTTLEQEGLKGALGVEKALARTNPQLRTMQSESIETRRTVSSMTDVSMSLAKEAEGLTSGPAVETLIKLHHANVARSLVGTEDLFVRYRLGRAQRFGDMTRLAISDAMPAAGAEQAMTAREFREAVGEAMIRGDKHATPEVAQAATLWREKVFDPLKQKAIELKLLDPDVDVNTAESYLMRVYNVEKMAAQRPQMADVIRGWLEKEQGEKQAIQTQVRELVTQRAARQDEMKKAEGRLETQERKADVAGTKAEEVRRLNEFAYKRAEALRLPLEDVRAKVDAARAKIAPHMEVLSQVKGEEDAIFAGIADAVRRMDAAEGIADLAAGIDDFARLVGELRNEIEAVAATSGRQEAHARFGLERLTDLEDARKELGWMMRPFRKAIAEAEAEASKAARPRIGKAQGGAVFETEIRRRGNTLADRASGATHAAGKLDARRQRLTDEIGTIEMEIADLVKRWPGKSDTENAVANAITDLSNTELRDLANEIIDSIISTPAGRLPYDRRFGGNSRAYRDDPARDSVRGPLRGRSFMIPDELIEPWLVKDIATIGQIYSRSMAADVEMVRRFGSVLLDQPGGPLKRIQQEAARRADNPALTEAERTRINDRKNDDIRDVEAMRDRLLGVRGMPDDPSAIHVRAARLTRDWNVMTHLGGMTISAITDIARPVAVHGMMRFIGDGVVPLVTNLRQFRMAAGEVEAAGTALDMVLNTRTHSMFDMEDFAPHSKFERGVKALTNKFSIATLMAPWNAAWKQFAGVMTQTRMLKAAQAFADGRLSAKEREYLAFLGLDDNAIARVGEQFRAHGEIGDGGTMWANTAAWTDREAVEAFRAGLVKDVDRIIVTPGVGDKPLIADSSEGMKLIFQFKSFAFASVQKTLISGLQQRDAAALNGALLSVALGMAGYKLYSLASGRDTSDDPKVWLAEGMERSGLFGLAPDVANFGAKLAGVGATSRHQSRGQVGALLGPTFGAANDLLRAGTAAASGEPNAADIHAVRRLIPGQNLFYLRRLLDEGEEGVTEALGVSPTTRRNAR